MKIKKTVIICLGTVTLFSCKKEYTCTCLNTTIVPDYEYGGVYYSGSSTSYFVPEIFKESHPSNAKAYCYGKEYSMVYESPNAQQGQGFTTVTNKCDLIY